MGLSSDLAVYAAAGLLIAGEGAAAAQAPSPVATQPAPDPSSPPAQPDAQAAPASPVAPSPNPVGASAGPTEPANAGEIVVTGSRIARRDYVADSPIVTVGQELLRSTGQPTVEAGLNQLPQVSSSASSSADFTSRGGQASLDLRGLGQQRTLVLLDGRRLQPSSPDGSIDLNTLPPSLIENVEVITGGASATYGSDAVSGVVNLKLRRRFTGAELTAQTGVSSRGDGQTQDVNALVGTDFADKRGNVFVDLDYSKREPVAFTARSYLLNQALTSRLGEGVTNVNTTNLPSQAAVNAVFARYGYAAGTVPRTSALGFNTDGTLFVQTGPKNFRDPLGDNRLVYGGTVYDAVGNFLLAQTPLTRYSAFAHADFDVSSRVKLFAQALYTHYTVQTQGPPVVAGSGTSIPLTIPVTNPFIPADFAAVLASRPNPAAPFTIAKEIDGIGDRGERDRYDVYQFTLGASGSLPVHDISWDVYGEYGRTDYQATELNYPSSLALNRLLQAADGGRSLCDGGFDPFGLQPLSAGCAAYINRAAVNRTTLEQGVAEANVQGALVRLPAGDLRFAGGADYRRETYAFTPDPLIASGELANYLPINGSRGSTDVYEFYVEALAPLLRDLPLVRELNLDASYRYSHYNVVGGVSTYKIDGDWEVFNGFRLRGGYSRAIRAPSVGELYTAQQISASSLGSIATANQGDPCDVRTSYRTNAGTAAAVRALCLAQGVPTSVIDTYTNTNANTNFITAGNTSLSPEKADTYSIGAVWRPKWSSPLLSRLSVSVDYYNIRLAGAIGTITSVFATQSCFNANGSNPTYSASNYYCQLITRDPTNGLINQIVNPELNLGGYRTDGIDVAAEWSFGLGAVGLNDGDGRLTLAGNVTHLNSFKIQTLSGGPFLDYAGTLGNTQIDQFADSHPEWKSTSSVTYAVGPLSTSLRWRYIDRQRNASNVGSNGTAPDIAAVSYFDLDATFAVGSRFEFGAGVVNLADRAPPTVNANVVGVYASDPYTYDLVGRRFYFKVRARF